MRSLLDATLKRIATVSIASALTTGGLTMTQSCATTPDTSASDTKPQETAMAAVRYQIKDIGRAIGFYTELLGFELEHRAGDAFAMVSRGQLHLVLGGPGSSGSRPMPDGRRQEPGGWNRILLYVDDLDAEITRLEKAGVRFRNEIEAGPGGRQIQIEDPDGNPIELHEGGAGGKK
jgi:glyoxylase I family protein